MSAVLPTRRAHDRTREAVLWVEEERTRRDPEAPQDQVEPVWVLTTSATADASGDYPGVVTLYRAIDHTWEDLTAAVRVRGIAGETLANATRYACRPAGVTAGGEDLYVLIGPASGAGGITAYERTKYAGTIQQTQTGVTALSILRGLDLSAPVPGTYDTGLRLWDAEPAGRASVYLLPCAYNESAALDTTIGGAVIWGEQYLGQSKHFQNIIMDAGASPGDIRAIRFTAGTGYPGEIGTYPSPYGSGLAIRIRGRRSDTGTERSEGCSLTLGGSSAAGVAVFEGYNSAGAVRNPYLGVSDNVGDVYFGASGTFGTSKYLSGLFIGTSGGFTGVLG